MTPSDIAILKHALTKLADMPGAFVAWNPDSRTCRRVARVGPTQGEASEVAYLYERGHTTHYVTLDNAELADFIIATPLSTQP